MNLLWLPSDKHERRYTKNAKYMRMATLLAGDCLNICKFIIHSSECCTAAEQQKGKQTVSANHMAWCLSKGSVQQVVQQNQVPSIEHKNFATSGTSTEAPCSDWLCWKTAYWHRWSTHEYYSARACRCNTAISRHLKIPSAYVRLGACACFFPSSSCTQVASFKSTHDYFSLTCIYMHIFVPSIFQ